MSKITFGTSVIAQLVGKESVNWNMVALGLASGVSLLVTGLLADKRGDHAEK